MYKVQISTWKTPLASVAVALLLHAFFLALMGWAGEMFEHRGVYSFHNNVPPETVRLAVSWKHANNHRIWLWTVASLSAACMLLAGRHATFRRISAVYVLCLAVLEVALIIVLESHGPVSLHVQNTGEIINMTEDFSLTFFLMAPFVAIVFGIPVLSKAITTQRIAAG